MNIAGNCDTAFQSYRNAGTNGAAWANRNAAAWQIVSKYLAEQLGI